MKTEVCKVSKADAIGSVATISPTKPMEYKDHFKNGENPKSQMGRGNIMQKTSLSLIIFCISMASTFAQDVITLKNGDEIQAIVQDIGDIDVKYKKFDNPNGPNYTLKKSEIFMIRYQNGTKDVFQSENQVEKNTKTEVSVASTNISSINDCNAKELGRIFSIGFEVINNYQVASEELNKTQILLDYFSKCAKSAFGSLPIYPSDLAELNMTKEELGAEIVNRIGHNSRNDEALRGAHSLGNCSKKNAKKMQDILTKEFDAWKTAYFKAEKALEEKIDTIFFITPKYRYPLALKTMLEFVENFNASTYKECANLYDTMLNAWISQAQSAEMIEIQRQTLALTGQIAKNTKSIARSSRATAIFTGLIYFGL